MRKFFHKVRLKIYIYTSHPSYDRSVHSVVLTDDGCQGEFRWTGWREIGLSSPWTDDTKRCAGLPVSHQMVNERDTGDRVTNTTNQIIKSKPCVQWRTPGEGDDVSAEFEPLLCFSASCLKIYFHLTALVGLLWCRLFSRSKENKINLRCVIVSA